MASLVKRRFKAFSCGENRLALQGRTGAGCAKVVDIPAHPPTIRHLLLGDRINMRKASVENINSVQRRVKIELGADTVSQAFDSAFKQIQRKAQIQGFRPGKAPLQMIKKFYGNKAAYEVLDQLIKDNLFAALEENKLRPIAQPVLEQLETLPASGKDYSFTAVVDILPEIKLPEYKGVAVTAKPIKVGPSDVEKELEMLRKRQANMKTADAGTVANAGHVATLSHTATHHGKAIEAFNAKKFQVELGSEQLFDALEKAVYGMKVGENKMVHVDLPADYPEKELAGQHLHFDLHLDALQELVLPELNDEFAKDIGAESVEKLREQVQKSLEDNTTKLKRQNLETAIMDQLLSKSDFDVPPAMVDQVIDSMIDGLQWPDPKEKEAAKKDDEFRRRFRDNAKRQAKNTLLLMEIVKNENLQVTDADVDSHISTMMGNAPGMTSDNPQMAQLRQMLGSRLRERLIFEKALNFLIDNAKITEAKA